MIVLLNPPNPPDAVSNKDTMGGLGQLYPARTETSLPPLDIPLVAALLRDNGVPIHVVDCLGSRLEVVALTKHLTTLSPKFIGVRTSLPTFNWDMDVAHLIKKLVNAKLFVFGSYVSLAPDAVLNMPFIDAIVLGEPEYTILEIGQRETFEGCEGTWYKDGAQVIKNAPRTPIDDLDGLPFPAWDMMPYHAYKGGQLMKEKQPFVTALTSRGCPHGCGYCPYPVAQGRKSRMRSPDNVVQEMEWLDRRMGVRAVLFRDPEFARNRDRVVGICEGLISRGVRIAWRCETRMEDLDEPLISLMARAGCIGINMGVENADPGIMRNLNRKGVPMEKARRIMGACRKNHISTFCFFILGLPGETKESVIRNVNFALKLQPDFAQFTIATPYPGTELYEWAERNGYIEDSHASSLTSYRVTMRNETMTVQDMLWAQEYANRKWEMQLRKIIPRITQYAYQWIKASLPRYKLNHILHNKVILITGGGSGIGRSIALMLVEYGAKIVLAGRSLEPLQQVSNEIRAKGGEALIISADVADSGQVISMAQEVLKLHGRVDVLVNNAGTAVTCSCGETSEMEWDKIIDTNLKGVFLCCRELLQTMISAHSGIIINISSNLGWSGIGNMTAYCASKFGVVGFTQALAHELKNSGVLVYALCPGSTFTDLHRRLVGEEIAKAAMPPERVAAEALNLITGRSRPPTGSSIIVEGYHKSIRLPGWYDGWKARSKRVARSCLYTLFKSRQPCR